MIPSISASRSQATRRVRGMIMSGIKNLNHSNFISAYFSMILLIMIIKYPSILPLWDGVFHEDTSQLLELLSKLKF